MKDNWETFAKNSKFKTISALIREALDFFIKLYPKLDIDEKEGFDILSGLSYELKEQLTLIKVNLQILKEVHGTNLDENVTQIINNILNYSQNLENKIIDYLDTPEIKQVKKVKAESTPYDIFLIEADYETRKSLINYFNIKGISCKGISDGFSFFKELKISVPRLILLNIMLPGRQGDDVLRDLKSEEKYKDIPIYFITALSEHKVIKMSEDLGATGYILKPFNLSDFDEIIKFLKKGK